MATRDPIRPTRRALLAAPLALIPLSAPSNAFAASRHHVLHRNEQRLNVAQCANLRQRIRDRSIELGMGKRQGKKIRNALIVYLDVSEFSEIEQARLREAQAFIDAWPASKKCLTTKV